MSNKDKFMELYEPIHPRLCKYIQSFVWDRDEAKDLISEVTLQAFEKFNEIRKPEAFVYYVFSIARNSFIRHLRKNKFREKLDEEQMNELPGGFSSDQQVKKYELFMLLSKLEPLNREVLVLFEISGFSYKEISLLKELSESQVKALLYQTRQQLKELVATEDFMVKQHTSKNKSHE